MTHRASALKARAVPMAAVLGVLAALLSIPTTAQAGASDQAKPLTRSQAAAHQVLADAVAALHPSRQVGTAAAQSRLPGARNTGADATLALAKLFGVRDQLSAADRATADRLTDRPSIPVCASNSYVVIHCVESQLSGFTKEDVLNTATSVAKTYVQAGYRAPKNDSADTPTNGGNGLIDIYLQNDLDNGLYGYCAPIGGLQVSPNRFDVPAYCGLRTEYAGFPLGPLPSLRVTIAHEYFHATQFAYDVLDDTWFLESTAAWVEDEVYSSINDNRQYLRNSPLGTPRVSMDSSKGIEVYGSWIWFRYLTEMFPKKQGKLPKIVLDMWKLADSSHGYRNGLYSLEAIKKVLAKRGKSFDKVFGKFSADNRHPGRSYREGKAYKAKPLAGSKVLAKGGSKAFRSKPLNHLTSASYRFTPKKSLGSKARLKLSVDMPKKATHPVAVVQVTKKNGRIITSFVSLSKKGNGAKTFGFGGVKWIEVTLVNASARFVQCGSGRNPYSCLGGRPVDQGLRSSVVGKVV